MTTLFSGVTKSGNKYWTLRFANQAAIRIILGNYPLSLHHDREDKYMALTTPWGGISWDYAPP